MKKIFYTLFGMLLLFEHQVFAWDTWVFVWLTWSNNMSALERIRKWDIRSDDIPGILQWATNYLMWFAGTIAIIFIIIWAYKIAFWGISWDKSDGKKTVFLALWWFALASVSWLILKIIIDNFS